MNGRTWFQDRDPCINSEAAKRSWKKLVTEMFKIPPRSPDINPTENTCGALRDLVPFLQFKKREKHPWRSVNFSKVTGFKAV